MPTAALLPLLETMSKVARAAWPHIEHAVAEGIGTKEIEKALRDAGMGIRRQDLLALVREANLVEMIQSDIRRLPRDFVTPLERVRRAATKIVGPIGYTVKVTINDALSGRQRTQLLTAHSTEPLSFAEVEALMFNADGTIDSLPMDNIAGVEVVDMYQSGEAGTI